MYITNIKKKNFFFMQIEYLFSIDEYHEYHDSR